MGESDISHSGCACVHVRLCVCVCVCVCVRVCNLKRSSHWQRSFPQICVMMLACGKEFTLCQIYMYMYMYVLYMQNMHGGLINMTVFCGVHCRLHLHDLSCIHYKL